MAAVIVGLIWLLFGGEPDVLSTGVPNLLAGVPATATGLAFAGAVPLLLRLLRRPIVAANHFALSVRPGALRTLVLPWALVDRVAVTNTSHGRYLLVRYRRGTPNPGTRLNWWDRGALRRLGRTGAPARQASAGYDLAVNMADFAGGPGALVAAVAAFAPDHVVLGGELDPE